MKQAQILLIEDTDSVREVLTRQLEVLGAHVIALGDGLRVKEFLDHTVFDLVITDMELPDCKGTDVARLVKDRGYKVILLSGDGHLSVRPDVIAAGFNDVLVKPVALSDLQRLMKNFSLTVPDVAVGSSSHVVDMVGPLDMEMLREQMGDLDEVAFKMISKFPDMMRPLVQNISDFAAVQNLVQLSEVAHSLKGAARSAGALHLGSLCEQVQELAQNGQLDMDGVSQLQNEFIAVEAAIKKICA